MGKKDISLKPWLKDSRRFADLFNGVCFGGEQVILPEKLEELDSESDFVFHDKKGGVKYTQRYRDMIKGWNGFVLRAILATELQDKVHYGMPVKNMIMDAMSYTDQMKDVWDGIPVEEKKQLMGSADYFSRFRKEDKLCPVITLVFYWGDEWDGNINLYDMFELEQIKDDNKIMEFLEKYVPNYHINLFNPANAEDITVFKTDLQRMFGVLQCRQDKQKLHAYVNEHRDFFSDMDYDSANALRVLLGAGNIIKDEFGNKKEGNDVCKALEDIYNDGIESSIISLIRKGKLTLEDGAEELGISVDEIKAKINAQVSV